MYHRGGGARPLWEGWNVVSGGGVVDLINKDAKGSGGLVARVRTELRVNLNDEGGGHGREQTSLMPELAHDCAKVEKKLTKMRVVSKSSYFLRNSLSYS